MTTESQSHQSHFERIGAEVGRLVAAKNAAYGDSFARSGEILAILYPGGIRVEQYRDALAVVRVVDKLFRIATRKGAFGESPWRDVAGYGILGAASDESTVRPDVGPVEAPTVPPAASGASTEPARPRIQNLTSYLECAAIMREATGTWVAPAIPAEASTDALSEPTEPVPW